MFQIKIVQLNDMGLSNFFFINCIISEQSCKIQFGLASSMDWPIPNSINVDTVVLEMKQTDR